MNMSEYLKHSAPSLLALALLFSAAALGQTTRATPGTSAVGPNGEVTLFGSTEPVAKVEVPAALKGILAEVNVKEGQAIKAGDVLARMDDAVQKAALELASLKANQTSQIQGAQNQIEFAQNAVEVLRGRGSPTEIHEKELAYKQSLLALEVYKDEQKQAQVQLQQEQITLDHMTLKSPIDGFVLRVHKQPGEQTDEGPVVTVVQTNRLSAIFFLPKDLFGQVKVGDTAALDFEGITHRDGTVVAVDPSLSAGLFRVKLEVANADARIPAGINTTWVWKK